MFRTNCQRWLRGGLSVVGLMAMLGVARSAAGQIALPPPPDPFPLANTMVAPPVVSAPAETGPKLIAPQLPAEQESTPAPSLAPSGETATAAKPATVTSSAAATNAPTSVAALPATNAHHENAYLPGSTGRRIRPTDVTGEPEPARFDPQVTPASAQMPAPPLTAVASAAASNPPAVEPPSPSELKITHTAAKATTDEPRPWLPLMVALIALFASLGANIYLGWITRDLHARYRRLTGSLPS
ncbi:MAG: hypothetical protein JSS27_12315 [Planctomycetes bacterium]|nr:hypothetical protein [Planctomycetota bacterium]